MKRFLGILFTLSFIILSLIDCVEGGFYSEGGKVDILSGVEISLVPGWNVLSTPAQLSGIYYGWAGCGDQRWNCINSRSTETEYLEFFILSGGKRKGIKPTTETIKPLEGLLVKSYYNDWYDIIFAYDENYSGNVFSKNLSNGRNFLGITNTYNPLSNITNANIINFADLTLVSNYTGYGTQNWTNKVIGSGKLLNSLDEYTGYQLGEAYGAYIEGNNGIYTGFNRVNDITNTIYQECIISCQSDIICMNDCWTQFSENEDKVVFIQDENFGLNYDGMIDGVSWTVPLISGYIFVDSTGTVHIEPLVDIVVNNGLADTSIGNLKIGVNIDGNTSPYFGQIRDEGYPLFMIKDDGSYNGKVKFGVDRNGFLEGIKLSGGYHSFMLYANIENITGFIEGAIIKLGDLNETSIKSAHIYGYSNKGIIISGSLPSATITMKDKSNILGLNVADINNYKNYAIEKFGIDEELPVWKISAGKNMSLEYRIKYTWIEKYDRYNPNSICNRVDPIFVINPSQPVDFKYYIDNLFYSGSIVNNSRPIHFYSGLACYPTRWNTFTMTLERDVDKYISGYGTVDLPIGTELEPTFIVYNIYDGNIRYYYQQNKEYIVTGGKYTIVNNYGNPINIDNFIFTGINGVHSGDIITLFDGPIYSLQGNANLQRLELSSNNELLFGENFIFELYINNELIDTKIYTGNSVNFDLNNLDVSREINNFKINTISHINHSGTYDFNLKGYGIKDGNLIESNNINSVIETKVDINSFDVDSGGINILNISSNNNMVLVNSNIGGFSVVSEKNDMILKYLDIIGLEGQSLNGLNLSFQQKSGGFTINSGVIPLVKSGDLRILEDGHIDLLKGEKYIFSIKGLFNVNTATGITNKFSAIINKIVFENNSGYQYITGNILINDNVRAVGAYPSVYPESLQYETGDTYIKYKVGFSRLQFPLRDTYDTITINKIYLSGSHNLLSDPEIVLYEAINEGGTTQGTILSGILWSGLRNNGFVEIDSSTLMHYNGYVTMIFTLSGINWETINGNVPEISLQIYDMDYVENFGDGTTYLYDKFCSNYRDYNRIKSYIDITN